VSKWAFRFHRRWYCPRSPRLSEGEDKDEKAKAYLARFEKKQGMVLIGKAQEKALGYKGQRKDHGTKVWFDYSRQSLNVTYYFSF